jgi:hypothetical protein
MEYSNRNIALLIDSENISPQYLPLIIDEANRYGKINYKRVYGDWTTKQLTPWKALCMEYGLTPVQQYSYISGKNASDFTLVIDAMDILYRGKVDSFCIVSSDSDFTKLVTRLKEDNMFVFGMGESKTPISLVNSCETFAYLDKMLQVEEDKKEDREEKPEPVIPASKRSKKKIESSITPMETIAHELKTIIRETAEDDGWSYWGNVAQLLQRKFPGFHPRNYGENIKALAFFKKRNDLEFEQRKSSIFVRCL